MLQYEDYLFMFGGIQDVTKEKNDIYIYQFSKAEWNKIHTTTNSVYDCSPTLKRDSKVIIPLFRRTKVQRYRLFGYPPTKLRRLRIQ
jgi:hypothetical protein